MSQLNSQDQARNEQVSITTTSSKIAYATMIGQPRKKIILRNTSPNAADVITISLGSSKAEVNKGIVLRQNDTYMESTTNEPLMDVWQGDIQAVCETATGKLSINEV